MHFSTALGAFSLTANGSPGVQARPTLGASRAGTPPIAPWLLPVANFASASIALIAVSAATHTSLFPAFPLAPILPVTAFAALRAYAPPPSVKQPVDGRLAFMIIRLQVAILFVWFVSLFDSVGRETELIFLTVYLCIDLAARNTVRMLLRRLTQPERWLLVGEESTAELLRRYEPLAELATVVGSVQVKPNGSHDQSRVAALNVVDRHRADRVLISPDGINDKGLLELVRAFKSIGVPVSMLPRPLDLLEAPAATPVAVGGVPQIEVRALATHAASPYRGPDRRHHRMTRISVVMPAKNEALNIGLVLRRVPEYVHEVILVDGNSSDDTVAVAQREWPGIRVLMQAGRGKGDALRTGFAAVTGNVVIMLDADGSAAPEEIDRFVRTLEDGADFAKGSRFLTGGGSDDITLLRRYGNAFLSGAANLLHGTHFTDLCYGYNGFWARCLPFVSLDVPGFEVETLINLRVADAGMKVVEVPSHEANRIHGQSNLNTFRDGFRVLRTILREAQRNRTVHPGRHPVVEWSIRSEPERDPT